MNFSELARRGSQFAINNSPTILTTIGVVGTITTAYLAGKASFEASDIIRLKEGTEGVSDDPKQRIKERVDLVWKLYIPPAVMGVSTIACIIGANRVGVRRAAGMAAAYTIMEKSFDEYRDKVVEKLGPRKEEAARDEIMQDRVSTAYLDDVKIYGLEDGEVCYDLFSDRYFRGTVQSIKDAENDLNFALIHDGYASLSELYQHLGLPSLSYAENIGWNSDNKLSIRIVPVLNNDKPCLGIEFKPEPSPDYGRFHQRW